MASPRIHTNDADPGEVLLSLTHPRNQDGVHTIRLQVQDLVSGQLLTEVEMSPSQFADLMSSAATRVPGARLPTHPERIGKRAQDTSTALPHGDPRSPEEVRDAYLADGWETATIDRTNFGHRVVARRWIAT